MKITKKKFNFTYLKFLRQFVFKKLITLIEKIRLFFKKNNSE